MKWSHDRSARHALVAFVWLVAAGWTVVCSAAPAPERPPPAEKRPVTEIYFGTKITDPYRWMESLDERTIGWIKAQGAYTRAVLDSIEPRAEFLRKVSAFTASFGELKSIQRYGSRTFYLERAPAADSLSLMVREADGAVHTLIDIAAVRAAHGGAPCAINYFLASPDGRRVAAGISEGGSENADLTVYDVGSRQRIAGPVSRAQVGALAWSADGSTLYFNRLADAKDRAARYLNSAAVAWRLTGDPTPVFGATVGHGPAVAPEQLPMIGVWPGASLAAGFIVNGVQNELEIWITEAGRVADPAARWRRLATREDGVTGIEMAGSRIYLQSHNRAPTFQVLALNAGQAIADAKVVLPAREDRIVESIHVASDGLYVVAREGIWAHLLRVPLQGGAADEVPLPFQGAIGEAFTDPREPGVTFGLESFVAPLTAYRFDPRSGRVENLHLTAAQQYDPKLFVTTDLRARAADGAMIPLTLIRPAAAVNGSPLLLYAYGSYGISTLPNFRPLWIPLMESGVSTAYCHVRGGGELGEAWRLAGKDDKKPNTWRDLIACAEDLVARGIATPKSLFIRGGSAGGITMGRAMEERPELFAGVIDLVPSANTLRAELTPGGPANIPEFGTAEDPQGFANLLGMDSYQGVRDGVQYPPIMITTGLNDPRVDPWEPAKLAARLLDSGTRAPVLLRVDADAGHGIGSTKGQDDQLAADVAAFIFWNAGKAEWQPTVR